MNLVTITGMKRHGKDTLAGHLVEYFASVGLTFERASLADPIKNLVADELGVTREALEALKRESPAIRQRLQDAGQAQRELDPDYWIDRLLDRLDNDRNYVITDARYENELEVLGMFGPRVLIYRPGIDDGDGHPSEAFPRHLVEASGVALPGRPSASRYDLPCDFSITNAYTTEALRRDTLLTLGPRVLAFIMGFNHGQNTVTWSPCSSSPDTPAVRLPAWVRREMEKNQVAQAAAVAGM